MPRPNSRLASLLLPALTACALTAAAPATAAPIEGPADLSFYTPPSSVPAAGTPGELISYRRATINLGHGAPAVDGWNVLYRSTDAKGAPNFVTGTVIVPKVPSPAAAGERPTIAFTFGTPGLSKRCAPSRQIAAGTEFDGPSMAAALKRGYALVASDYEGYTTGTSPTYTAGASQGHAVLDITRAARQIPSAPVKPAPTFLWGYSEGGQSSSWAAELAPTYAPELDLRGAAPGGVPADLRETSFALNRNAGAGFLFQVLPGLAEQYPELIDLGELLSDRGRAVVADVKNNLCMFDAMNKYGNADVAELLQTGEPLEDLLARPGVAEAFDRQKLGRRKVGVPVYLYQGAADQLVPLDQAYELKKAWCARGTKVHFELFASEHLVTAFQAAPYVLDWMGDRLAGKPAPTNCWNGLPDPASTEETRGGDFIFDLDGWGMSGKATIRKLGQSMVLPAGSVFDGTANVTAEKLDGVATIKPFTTDVTVLGIKTRVAVKLVQSAPVHGKVAWDTEGNFTVDAVAPMWVWIQSLSVGPIKLGTDCRTAAPVQIPLKFAGPLNALGLGTFTSKTTATFPNLTGCGLYGPMLSATMSGPGNTFELTQTPPAPRGY